MPGTVDEWPNWSIALPEPIDDLVAGPRTLRSEALTDRGSGLTSHIGGHEMNRSGDRSGRPILPILDTSPEGACAGSTCGRSTRTIRATRGRHECDHTGTTTRHLNRRPTARRDDGAAMVEFAFVGLLFVLFLTGIISFGLILSFKQNLTQAAAEGARAGATAPTGARSAGPRRRPTTPCRSFDEGLQRRRTGVQRRRARLWARAPARHHDPRSTTASPSSSSTTTTPTPSSRSSPSCRACTQASSRPHRRRS